MLLEDAETGTRRPAAAGSPAAAAKIVGTLLIAAGTLLVVDIVEPGWIDGRYVGPAVLIALGLGLLVRGAGD